MAHVGAVGQVVVPISAREQGIEIRRLQPRLAGRVERRALGVERAQLGADGAEGFRPARLQIAVARRVVAQRMRQAALALQVVVAPAREFGDAVAAEEAGTAAGAGQVPDRRLGAALAELRDMRLRRLRPRAGRAHVAARLVLMRQRIDRARPRLGLSPRFARCPRPNPSRRQVVGNAPSPARLRLRGEHRDRSWQVLGCAHTLRDGETPIAPPRFPPSEPRRPSPPAAAAPDPSPPPRLAPAVGPSRTTSRLRTPMKRSASRR